MSFDLTAILLGDPAAAQRRAPTDAERSRGDGHGGHASGLERLRFPKGFVAALGVGEVIEGLTKSQANNIAGYWRRHKGKVRERIMVDGSYRIERVA